MSYPNLHLGLLKSLIDGSQRPQYRQILLKCLTDDKDYAAKGRLSSLKGIDPMISSPTVLSSKAIEKIDACLRVIYSFSLTDKRLVEKTYWILDDLISYIKLEGLEEMVDYFDTNPHLFDKYRPHMSALHLTPEGGFFRTIHRTRRVIHLINSQDPVQLTKTMINTVFLNQWVSVRDYCEKYYQDSYKLVESIAQQEYN